MWAFQRLRGGEPLRATDLAREFEVAVRTAYRDLDFLRDEWRVPLEYDRHQGTYRLTEPVAPLPLVSLSQGELIAIYFAEKVLRQYRGTPFEADLTSDDVDSDDPDRVASDFAAADHQHRALESERQELRDRMRAWMEHAQATEWGGFVLSDSTPRLNTDIRHLAEWLRDGENPPTGLPGRFLQALGPTQAAGLDDYVDAAATPVLRWRPDRTALPVDMAQSRDWHAEDDGD